MTKLMSGIRREISGVRRWNPLQWLLLIAIIAIVVVMAIPNWGYPPGGFIDEEGNFIYDPELTNPTNPRWVNFIQRNDGLGLFAIFICVGLGLWITKISRRRHDEILSWAHDELPHCEQEENFVEWYHRWKKEGLTDDDLINCFIGRPIPSALKRELERQGKKIIFKTDS